MSKRHPTPICDNCGEPDPANDHYDDLDGPNRAGWSCHYKKPEPFMKEQHVQTMSYDKLAPLREHCPIGARVVITAFEDKRFVRAHGEVVAYYAGEDWNSAPMVIIRFITPVMLGFRQVVQDAFYDDEFVVVAVPT